MSPTDNTESPALKLANRVAVITGGTKGIGLGCASVFGRHGASVVIAARNEQSGREAEGQLKAAGVEALFVSCDVCSEQDMQQLFEQAITRFGQIDCLVNNAGWHPPTQSIEDVSVKEFEQLVRLNLTSTFMGCKFAIPHLRKTQGSIINMSSAVAAVGQAAAPAYVSTKAGQIGLTKALALDLAPDGVRVNAVCPAGVMTPLMRDWANSEYNAEEALAMVDRWHPLGRMATVEEIGEVCAFLASAEASFITGQEIFPDGGASLGYAEKAPAK
ncbi:MAG: glucose 1-dehydrogenase [Planctomycetes bacterium]|nr:glucose 1-dehydrogenase [Planctomycetota bacterium]